MSPDDIVFYVKVRIPVDSELYRSFDSESLNRIKAQPELLLADMLESNGFEEFFEVIKGRAIEQTA